MESESTRATLRLVRMLANAAENRERAPMPLIHDQRVFLPTKDLARSVAFYELMGWTVKYRDEQIVFIDNGASRIFLQRAYEKLWAENTMVHFVVDDAHAWFERATRVKQQGAFDDVKIRAPFHESYGATVTHVIDPAGVLLHFAQLDVPETNPANATST